MHQVTEFFFMGVNRINKFVPSIEVLVGWCSLCFQSCFLCKEELLGEQILIKSKLQVSSVLVKYMFYRKVLIVCL